MSTAPTGNPAAPTPDADNRLDALLNRIQELTKAQESGTSPPPPARATQAAAAPPATGRPQPPAPPASAPPTAAPATRAPTPVRTQSSGDSEQDIWIPTEPEDLPGAGLSESEVEAILLKCLNGRSEATGRYLAEHVRLPFRLVDPLLHSLKYDQMVAHKGAAMMNDYVYTLTDLGRERAKKLAEQCTYFGAAPVRLEDYVASVAAQTMGDQHPTEGDLKRAFSDLLIDQRMLLRLGPAINSGRGMFLFGFPGNGKTSIAERITKAFGEHVWIPRSLGIEGEIMRLFDPGMHEESPLAAGEGLLDDRKIDQRWIRIKRPTIIVGGELTMEALEVTYNPTTKVSESPVQLKSNCGTLVIDDFGRQRMAVDELLNRWIIPLEKRYDFLNMSTGKKIQVPFDQLIVFSTNLEPKDLVDDAFLRRIPYKIEVEDPTEMAFRQLFSIMAPIIGVEYDEPALNYLVDTHYKAVERPYRCCQPRDLLQQIKNYCHYINQEPKMSVENFDFAVENYFAVM